MAIAYLASQACEACCHAYCSSVWPWKHAWSGVGDCRYAALSALGIAMCATQGCRWCWWPHHSSKDTDMISLGSI